MNKGIFQTGSLGKCEKQSDIFHHIRYANSPRAAIPQKSAEELQAAFSLEGCQNAKSKLFQKLKTEGLEHSGAFVRLVAKGIKSVLFFLFCMPYLALTKILSKALSLVRVRAVAHTRPPAFLKTLNAKAQTQLARFFNQRLERRKGSEKNNKLQTFFQKDFLQKRFFSFFASFKLLVENFSEMLSNRIRAFSLPLKKKAKPVEVPQEVILDAVEFEKELVKRDESKNKFKFWTKWSFPSVKFPRFNLPELPRIQLPKLPKFKLPTFLKFKLPKLPRLPALRWNPHAYMEKFAKIIQTIRDKADPKKIDKAIRETFRSLLDKLLSFFGELEKKVSQRIKRSREARIEAKKAPPSPTALKMQKNLQVIKDFSEQVKEKTESIVREGILLVSIPVVRSRDAVSQAVRPVKRMLFRWGFLVVIVFELSMLLLEEAIYEFKHD